MTSPSDAGSAPSDGDSWRQQRREASAAHSEALDRRRAAEAGQARAMLTAFVSDALDHGPAPVPLHARSFNARHRYRTALTGWYLKQNESVAVGTDGEFYILSVPSSVSALLRGAHPHPSDPPLVIGAGGRDGESIDLVAALARLSARRDG
jgi:hypothetical protein